MKYIDGSIVKVGDVFTDGARGREDVRLKYKINNMKKVNKNTEVENIDKKLHISDVSDSIKKLPERCPCCFRKADFTDTITRNGEEYETDAWFCNFCGGLVCWK